MMEESAVEVRLAQEEDVGAIREIFLLTYGEDYPYNQFYDERLLKKVVYSDNYLFLVATVAGRVAGAGAIYFDVGSYTDLLGEFGRLVVHPEFRHRGIGKRLMEARLQFAEARLQFGYIEGRTEHPFAQRIAEEFGFAPLGFAPQKFRVHGRESLALMGKLFGNAQALRRNNPRIIPEAYPLAASVLTGMGLPNDLIPIEESEGYPFQGEFELESLEERGIPNLLRIERGRLKRREIFGNMMLSYGQFLLQARKASYLVAKRDGVILGAIGYIHDALGKTLRIFEMIDVSDNVSGYLLCELERRAREEMGVAYAEVSVSAYWPQMQRTLEQLGFCPVAYFPAYVFRGVERLDAILMVKLNIPFDPGEVKLTPAMEKMYDIVVHNFREKRIGIAIGAFARSLDIFDGLTDSQVRKISAVCKLKNVEQGALIFQQGEVDRNLYMVSDGHVDIVLGNEATPVGTVQAGDVLGEISLTSGAPHVATAIAGSNVQLVVLRHRDFDTLIQQNPRIGLQVMQNIARSLGNKLKTTNQAVSQLYTQD